MTQASGQCLKKISTLTMRFKSRATSLAFTRTTSPCLLGLQLNTHVGDMKFSPFTCYVAPKAPVSANARNSLSIACVQMTEYLSVHASSFVVGVKSLHTEHVGMGAFSCCGVW